MVSSPDPVKLEILKNALESIGDGMALTVVRTSRSTVVRQALDYSTGVLSSTGELIGQGFCLPIHLGGMMPALKACTDYYQDNIHPGDIFILNDPYEGGSHLPDIFLFKPVFIQGRIAAYLCAMTHHTDIGGRVAGGNACDSSEIYQEGIRIPPVKLYANGSPSETVYRLLEKAVRVPDMVMGDLQAQIAGLEYGETQYLELINQYGIEPLEQQVQELIEYTENLNRQAISQMPNGTWSFSDYIDDDGFSTDSIRITATVTKEKDELSVDFSGTSPQCNGAIQPVLATTHAVVYAVVHCLLGPQIPNTSGYFKPVNINAPEGTFVNPVLPAPVAARTLGLVRIANTLFGAFAQMLPQKVYAACAGAELGVAISGYNKKYTPWKPWVLLDFAVEPGMGAFSYRDGLDAVSAGMLNGANTPVEILEIDHPVKILEYEFIPDSEGPGMYRGGMGMKRTYQCAVDETTIQVRSDRSKVAPYGLWGGGSSKPTSITTVKNGHCQVKPTKFLEIFSAGDTLEVHWPGGGGWGNPLERNPDQVAEDILHEKISFSRAKSVYGVVFKHEDASIDWQSTTKLRSQVS